MGVSAATGAAARASRARTIRLDIKGSPSSMGAADRDSAPSGQAQIGSKMEQGAPGRAFRLYRPYSPYSPLQITQRAEILQILRTLDSLGDSPPGLTVPGHRDRRRRPAA